MAARLGRIELPPARPALEEDEREDDGEHDERDLRRALDAHAHCPGRVDRDGQRADAEELRSADVVQRLHQREADADGDRRARQRDGDAEEDAQAVRAERARDLERRRRLHQEDRADRQIDVGVEHHAEQEDAAVRASGSPGTRDRADARCRGARGASSAPDRAGAARRDRRRRRCRSGRRAAGAAPIRRRRLPGKRNIVTSQAVPTPIAATIAPTPTRSSTVVRMRVRQHVGDEIRPDVAGAAQRRNRRCRRSAGARTRRSASSERATANQAQPEVRCDHAA